MAAPPSDFAPSATHRLVFHRGFHRHFFCRALGGAFRRCVTVRVAMGPCRPGWHTICLTDEQRLVAFWAARRCHQFGRARWNNSWDLFVLNSQCIGGVIAIRADARENGLPNVLERFSICMGLVSLCARERCRTPSPARGRLFHQLLFFCAPLGVKHLLF